MRRMWAGRQRREQELNEELESHFRMAIEERVARGESPADAKAAAHREFGSEALVREVTREMWPAARLRQLLQDIPLALRTLTRSPRFSLAALACTGAGIGVTMTIVSALYAILLRPLPYPNADELVAIQAHHQTRGETGATISQEALDMWQGAGTLSDLAAWREGDRDLTGGEVDHARVRGASVDVSLLPLLGVEPLLGRWFDAAESEDEAAAVVILSHGLWQSRFGGDARIMGSEIDVSGRPHRVIGVMPAGFSFPEGVGLWLPLGRPRIPPDILFYNGVIARIAVGRTFRDVRAEFDATMREFHAQHAGYAGWAFEISTLRDALVGPLRKPIMLFQGAALLVLLLACANVAALLLARAAARRRELAIRAALGADGRRLMAHVLVESLTLAVLGGLLGTAIAWSGVKLLALAFPDGVPSYVDLGLHPPVLAATMLAVLATALAFGLAPALQAARTRANGSLAGRNAMSATVAGSRARGALVATEVAVSVVLLAGAMLLTRTHLALSQSLGFDSAGVLSVTVRLPMQTYADPDRRSAFYGRFEEQLRTLPSVTSLSASVAAVPLDHGTTSGLWTFRREDQPEGTDTRAQRAAAFMVAPGYFSVFGISLVRGRDLDRGDERSGEPKIVVNETFVRAYFPGDDVLGRRIFVETAPGRAMPPARVVGVVRDFRHSAPPAEIAPALYVSQPADAPTQTFVLHTDLRNPIVLAPAVRELVRELDSTLIVDRIQTQADIVQRTFWRQSLQRNVFGIFAALALLLAVFGVYGVLSYSVTQRTPEFGVRLALGATQRSLLLLVMAQAARLAAVGLIMGIAAAVALGRLLAGMLYGVRPADPVTLLGAAVILFLVAVGSAILPAVRSARLDPLVAIRDA